MSILKNNNAETVVLQLARNGYFPNNSNLPAVVYKMVFNFEDSDAAAEIENVFSENKWGGSWRNGIYTFHHFHSTAHEALGVYSGWAEVQMGGPEYEPFTVNKGDLIVLPAGTAHKLLRSGEGFGVVGAYPDNQSWDMKYGKENEFESALENISKVPLPKYDPVFGESGKIFELWK